MFAYDEDLGAAVFPARAGMSPGFRMEFLPRGSFPRTRGDEPEQFRRAADVIMFSPHARG